MKKAFCILALVSSIGVAPGLWSGNNVLASEPPSVSGWMEQFSFTKPPRPAPQTPFLAGDGTEITLGDFKGRIMLVNFWATWCAPCVAEMPSLDRLHRRLRDEGLVVLAVAVDEDADVLRRWVEARRLTLAILHDPRGRDVAARYGVSGYPVSFLVDRDGRVLENYVGPVEWDDPAAVAHYRGLLAGRGSDSGR